MAAAENTVSPETEAGFEDIIDDVLKEEEEEKQEVVDIASLPKFHISGAFRTEYLPEHCKLDTFINKFQNAHLCCLQSLRTSHRASFRMVLDTITTCDTGALYTMNFFLVLLVGLRNSRATCCDVGVIVAVIFDDCAKLSISSTAAMAKNSRIIVLAPILPMKCP